VQSKVSIQREQLEISMTDKNVLENNLRLVSIDLSNLTN